MEAQQVIQGRYRLLERIGEGGMSVVWQAHDEVLQRPVAVKVLAAPYATDPSFRENIRAEAQAAARLSHPNVANVYDYGESDDIDGCVPFVVMELLRGQSLRSLAGALAPDLALRTCAEIAGALAAAHAQHLVHRDVKPGNVMLTAAGAKVFDFGIAARVGDLDDVDVARMVVGTPAYLAPERIQGAPVVPASDVYSFGVLLYRAVTGTLPWPTLTGDELMMAHLEASPAPLPLLPGIPAEVGRLYDQCLAKDPYDRPSARHAAVVLAAAAGIRPPLADEDHSHTDGSGNGNGDDNDDDNGNDNGGGHGYSDGNGGDGQADWPERSTQVIRSVVAASGTRPAVARKAAMALALAAAAIVVGALAWTASTGGAVAAQLYGPGPVGVTVAGSATGDSVGGSGGDPIGDPGAAALPGTPSGQGTATRPAGGAPPTTVVEPIVVPSPPGPVPPGPAPTAAPTASGTSFTSPGGTVVAVCTGDQAYLSSWAPAPGYQSVDVDRGPRHDAKITFRAGRNESKFTVTCRAGVATAKIDNRH